MSVSSPASPGPDSDEHRLIYAAEETLVHALRDVRLARQYGQWSGPWADTIDLLRRAAQDLKKLHITAPAVSDDAAPCRWCKRPTDGRVLGQPGHPTCHARSGRVPAAEATAAPTTDAPATESPDVDEPDASEPFSDAMMRRPHQKTYKFDAAEELADFAAAVRAKPIKPDATDKEIQQALAAWHAAVQIEGEPLHFLSSPGYTGVSAYERLTAQYGSMVKPEPLTSDTVWELSTRSRSLLTVLSFINPAAAPVLGEVVTEADVNAQYLAAARSSDLGDGEPVELDQVPAADLSELLRHPGYVQLATAPDLTKLPVTARLPFASLADGWWLPAPAARYLTKDHGVTLDVARALTWPKGQYGRRMDRWCALFADGRATLAQNATAGQPGAALALKVLKSCYATFLGGMTRSKQHNDKGTLRPDWHDTYVSQAGVNALRAVDKALKANSELRLLGAMKDSFWLLGNEPVQPDGMTFTERNGQPGKWHLNRWGTVDQDIINGHARNRIGSLRKAITAADNARKEQQA